jgi:hypothetical protein
MRLVADTESLTVRSPSVRLSSPPPARAADSYAKPWPSDRAVELLELDLGQAAPRLPKAFYQELARLKQLIDDEWAAGHSANDGIDPPFTRRTEVADVLRRAADHLPDTRDRDQTRLRADCLSQGHDDDRLRELAQADGEVAVFAGPLATWFAKDKALRPSAFACRVDRALAQTIDQLPHAPALGAYAASLRSGLGVNEGPTFVPSHLFFMAGEGNLHPKHIAYFLPEDAGVKGSFCKKTYYFANTHRRLLQGISYPLFDRMVDLGVARDSSPLVTEVLPALSVYGHELGHGVARGNTGFSSLNKTDRWISVALQETCADVFGMLIVIECWCHEVGIPAEQAVAYYLGECLRYVHRGQGYFPDSDGMLFQLGYLHDVGALELHQTAMGPCLKADARDVVAGLRSLARVLADTVLDNQAELAIKLFNRYGPASHSLQPLVARLVEGPARSVEYVHESADTADNYYTTPRDVDGRSVSIYQIWETGGAYNDSVTPATYSSEYRSHIALKMERLTSTKGSIFSVGCGNAAIEGLLCKRGRIVSAIDRNEEAVELALRKGIDATCGDFTELPQGALMSYELVYADGLAGHLCDANTGLKPFLDAIDRAGLTKGARLLISNDAPRSPNVGLEPHGSVASFWLISHAHLAEQLSRVGFKVVESYTFPYHRPISGLRDRSICIAERL